MSPRLFAALVAVLAAFGAAGMLAAQRDVPPPVRQTTAQAIAVARDVPAIPALTPARRGPRRSRSARAGRRSATRHRRARAPRRIAPPPPRQRP